MQPHRLGLRRLVILIVLIWGITGGICGQAVALAGMDGTSHHSAPSAPSPDCAKSCLGRQADTAPAAGPALQLDLDPAPVGWAPHKRPDPSDTTRCVSRHAPPFSANDRYEKLSILRI